MKSFNIAILGCGRMGKMHLSYILENFPHITVTAIVENSLSKNGHYKNISTYAAHDIDHVLAQTNIDAVVIAASSASHVTLVKKSILTGKDVFCEKPVSFDIETLDEIMLLAKKHNTKLQVGFNRRWDSDFSKVQAEVAAGKLGNIHIVKITNRDPKRSDIEFAKRSGGLFLDFNVHDFDMARYITGSEVKQVYATGAVLVDSNLISINDIDTAIITLRMHSGALVVIDSSRETGYGYDQRLEVFGELGCLSVDNISETTDKLFLDNRSESDPPKYSFVERYQQAYINQLSAFFNYLGSPTNDQSPVSLSCVRKAVQIALASNQSLNLNKPIMLDEGDII